MRGDLLTPPRLRNPKIPKTINDIIMKAMAPDIHARYQRASDLLDDVLAAGAKGGRRPASTERRRAARRARHSDAAEGAREPATALLLAVPQAVARPLRSVSVLRRSSVEIAVDAHQRPPEDRGRERGLRSAPEGRRPADDARRRKPCAVRGDDGSTNEDLVAASAAIMSSCPASEVRGRAGDGPGLQRAGPRDAFAATPFNSSARSGWCSASSRCGSRRSTSSACRPC